MDELYARPSRRLAGGDFNALLTMKNQSKASHPAGARRGQPVSNPDAGAVRRQPGDWRAGGAGRPAASCCAAWAVGWPKPPRVTQMASEATCAPASAPLPGQHGRRWRICNPAENPCSPACCSSGGWTSAPATSAQAAQTATSRPAPIRRQRRRRSQHRATAQSIGKWHQNCPPDRTQLRRAAAELESGQRTAADEIGRIAQAARLVRRICTAPALARHPGNIASVIGEIADRPPGHQRRQEEAARAMKPAGFCRWTSQKCANRARSHQRCHRRNRQR